MSDCVFCAIAVGKVAAEIINESEQVLFFRDKYPKAPVHVLGIPKTHVDNFDQADPETIALLFEQAQLVARKLELTAKGYRLVINNGAAAGQEVEHLHVHIMGGEPLGAMSKKS